MQITVKLFATFRIGRFKCGVQEYLTGTDCRKVMLSVGLTEAEIGIVLVNDPDIFEEHNLNRQLLATPRMLGRAKVEAAQARVNEINPAVTVTPVREAFCPANGHELLKGVTVAADALDSISYRLELEFHEISCENPLHVTHPCLTPEPDGMKRHGESSGCSQLFTA